MGMFNIYQTFISVGIGVAVIFLVGGSEFIEIVQSISTASANLQSALK
jgi:hypothetical protein